MGSSPNSRSALLKYYLCMRDLQIKSFFHGKWSHCVLEEAKSTLNSNMWLIRIQKVFNFLCVLSTGQDVCRRNKSESFTRPEIPKFKRLRSLRQEEITEIGILCDLTYRTETISVKTFSWWGEISHSAVLFGSGSNKKRAMKSKASFHVSTCTWTGQNLCFVGFLLAIKMIEAGDIIPHGSC